MDNKIFKTLMKLFDAETKEILGDAAFAVTVLKIERRLHDPAWEHDLAWSSICGEASQKIVVGRPRTSGLAPRIERSHRPSP